MIVTSEVEDRAESLAVSRKAYVPEVENLAVVLRAVAFANVDGQGLVKCDHVDCTVPWSNPSWLAVPERVPEGKAIVLLPPALTTGAAFAVAALTVIVTSEVEDRDESLAVSLKA